MFHHIASGNKSTLIIIIFCFCIYNVSFLIWLVLCFVYIFPLSLAFTTCIICCILYVFMILLCFLELFAPNGYAAAKSLQLCPTLGDPIDGSPPGSPVPGILQARTLEWAAISFLQCVKVKLLSRVRLFATPLTAAHQAPPSMGFSRQEYWSGVPLPSLTIACQTPLSMEFLVV